MKKRKKTKESRILNAVIPLEGITSTAQAARIEQAAGELPGVSKVNLNTASSTLFLSYDSSLVLPMEIQKKAEECGCRVLAFSESGAVSEKKAADEIRKNCYRYFFRFILSVVLLAALLTGEKYNFSGLVMFFMAFIAWAVAGLHFHKGFFHAFSIKKPDMNMLVSMSSSVILLYGFLITVFPQFAGKYNAHWHDIALIMFFFNLGKWIESRYKVKAGEALEKLLRITPTFARRLSGRGEEIVPVKSVRKGDILLIRPGEQVPVDGLVTKGLSSVDESLLTGEAVPSSKAPGSHVFSGTFNQTGWFEFVTERVGEETTIMRIARAVQESQSGKKAAHRASDKIASWLVPVIIFIGIVAAVIWLICTWDFAMALGVFASIIAVACPCAMGIAVPVAVSIGFRRASALGVLIRNTDILDTVKTVNTVIFDKTGTLTDGTLNLKSVHPSGCTEQEFLELMALAENKSEHPFALAVRRAAEEKKIYPRGVLSFTAYPGRGVKAVCAAGELAAGSLRWFETEHIAVPDSVRTEFSTSPDSLLLLAQNGVFKGYATLGARLRSGAAAVVKLLRNMNIEPVLASGDRAPAVRAVAREVGIDVSHSGVFPDDKRNIVRRYKALGKHTVMVGDGFNDAPALSSADIGISLRSGADLAAESSDVTLMRNDLQSVVDTILILKRIRHIINQNLMWSMAYNIILVPLAAGLLYPFTGITVQPYWAVAAAVLGTLSVTLNSLRLRRMKL